ncbi:unnamed protein product [Gadus morhua 'NCC']
MDRLQFSRQILLKDLQFSTNELDYIFAFPGKKLGAFRSSAFYPGQPKQCRRCRSLNHLAASCKSNNCKRCRLPPKDRMQPQIKDRYRMML